jgi:modulator of FtsH protease HflC
MMRQIGLALAALAVLGLFVGSQALFTVDESQQALVLRFGELVGEARGPGLHVKLPFVEVVRRFDRRILAVDPEPERVVIAAAPSAAGPARGDIDGKEPILVDTFMRYRITDPLRFMKTLRTEEAAQATLKRILINALKSELDKTTLATLLSERRARVMHAIAARVEAALTAGRYGVELVDVRIVRTDLTPELRESTVARMRSALREQATQTRAEGNQAALEIKADADRRVTVILAEAERDAQTLRGAGDREATGIYAQAFNRDPEFYGLWRSLEAYRAALANPDTRLVLSPNDIAFFKHFTQGHEGQ